MTESSNELSELRQQAHFYRAQHARACKREFVLKDTSHAKEGRELEGMLEATLRKP